MKDRILLKIQNRLRLFRSRMNLTQADVARKSQISLRQYIDIENGKFMPRLKTAFAIAHALGETVDRIFILEKSNEK